MSWNHQLDNHLQTKPRKKTEDVEEVLLQTLVAFQVFFEQHQEKPLVSSLKTAGGGGDFEGPTARTAFR